VWRVETGKALGGLYVDNRTPRAFTDRDETILMRLAKHAAVAIGDARRGTDPRRGR
jgi:GAF domain-containing protein